MRVWITGTGLSTSHSPNTADSLMAIAAGRSPMAPVSLFDASALQGHLAAVATWLEVDPENRWSRSDKLAFIAAKQALSQADISGAGLDVIMGGSAGGLFETEPELARLGANPHLAAPDPAMARHFYAQSLERLSEQLGPFRRVRSVCSACSAGLLAIHLGAARIHLGHSERVLVGGVDSLSRLIMAGFDALRVMDPTPTRPFDQTRAGINLGEGAAFLVLEESESARRRGAHPLAELLGSAVGAESHHITQPEPTGTRVQALIRSALQRAGILAAELDWVHAHGTGTLHNDPAEARALRGATGRDDLRVSSTKAQTGHTLSASGAIGVALAAHAISSAQLFPTGGLQTPDPAVLPLRLLTTAEAMAPRAVLVNAFGFGGLDAVAVVGKVGTGSPAAPPRSEVVITGIASLGPWALADLEATRRILAGSVEPLVEDPPLDTMRARRFDRYTHRLTATLQAALQSGPPSPLAGLVVGSLFGNIATVADYCARSAPQGWRSPSFATFTNSVPSSQVANAGLYLGLQGPILSVSDFGTSTESAVITAFELLLFGDAPLIVAGGAAEDSPLIAQLYNPTVLGATDWTGPEAFCALVLETVESASERGSTVLARLRWADQGLGTPLLPPLVPGATVVLSWPSLAAALAGGWEHCPQRHFPQVGQHEATGGLHLVLAVADLKTGETVLVLGGGPGRWAAFLLEGG